MGLSHKLCKPPLQCRIEHSNGGFLWQRENVYRKKRFVRKKIRELLQLSDINSMEDIRNLFKETIAEFLQAGLDAELDEDLGYSRYDYRNKSTDNCRNGHSKKKFAYQFR